MAANTYECLLILDSNRYGRDPAGVSGQIERFVRNAGGNMLVSRLWEERRLAFPIHGHRRGTYWLSYFTLESGEVAGVEHECQLSESILRSLILKVDPRIAETLVTHAKGATPGKPVQAPPAAEPAPAEAETDEAPV